MASCAIGYYVHHHGDGHRQRAVALAAALRTPCTLLGTGLTGRTGLASCIDLPDDRMDATFAGDDGTASRPRSLHYAPVHHDGLRRRSAMVAAWLAEARPSLLMVDVSVEIAMLARLAATPTVYVRLSGDRRDPPHLEAFRGATALLAPFAPALEHPATPAWVRAKTVYAAGLSPSKPKRRIRDRRVVVVFGGGGGAPTLRELVGAARRTPHLDWHVYGPVAEPHDQSDTPSNLSILGWAETVDDAISEASIVVGSVGDGVVSAVLATGRPFVCLPQDRPFEEQRAKADALAAHDAAIVLTRWPDPDDWPGVLERAQLLRPPSDLHDPHAVMGTARWLDELAATYTTARHPTVAPAP